MSIEGAVPIEKLVYGGSGLSRAEGRVILTPFVLPLERVLLDISKERKDLLEGRVKELVETSEHRVAPQCKHFGVCGGCHYQHSDYGYQLEQKTVILREVLQRIGRIEAPADIPVHSASPWAYRNRVQLHFEDGRVGYREGGSHKLVPIEMCPISSPRLEESIKILRKMAKDRRFPRFLRSLELFTNESAVQVNVIETMAGQRLARGFFDWCEQEIPGAATGAIDYRAAGHNFRVSHRSFFQVNRYLIEELVNTALDGVTGESALELYAGVGLFSLALTDRFQSVVAVESNRSSIEDLRENAARARKEVTLQQNSAELFLETQTAAPDFLLADPPRAGLGPNVVKELVRLKPGCISIVSCDPSTLARDLKGLLEAGYAIRKLALIDLFPQTFHIETVTQLSLNA